MGLNEKFFKTVSAPVQSDYFEPLLFTGNGSARSIAGLNFSPALVSIKPRSNADGWFTFDTLRGVQNAVQFNSTTDQFNRTSLTAFNSDGFNLGNYAGTNSNNYTYLALCWSAPTSQTNSAGSNGASIASTIRKNVDNGFSIVSYTGNSASSATIGHGLSSAPELVIIKAINLAAGWPTLAALSGSIAFTGRLNEANATNSGLGSVFFNSTAPTSSVFSVGNSDEVNDNYNYIAYCFHSVSGVQKVGSYTGTGNSQSITTGFEPAFVMLRSYNNSDNWVVIDNKRGVDKRLYADLSNAESTLANKITFDSNGFTLTTSAYNASGFNFIYLAIA